MVCVNKGGGGRRSPRCVTDAPQIKGGLSPKRVASCPENMVRFTSGVWVLSECFLSVLWELYDESSMRALWWVFSGHRALRERPARCSPCSTLLSSPTSGSSLGSPYLVMWFVWAQTVNTQDGHHENQMRIQTHINNNIHGSAAGKIIMIWLQ